MIRRGTGPARPGPGPPDARERMWPAGRRADSDPPAPAAAPRAAGALGALVQGLLAGQLDAALLLPPLKLPRLAEVAELAVDPVGAALRERVGAGPAGALEVEERTDGGDVGGSHRRHQRHQA